MGMFDFIGEAIGNACSALAEFIGDALKAVMRPIMGEITNSITDAIPKMNAEAALGTIDEKMFKTKEFQELTIELKKRLEHSPEGVADWFKDTLGGIFGGFYDILIGVVIPSKIDSFDDAKEAAGYLTFLCVDMVLLIGVLDMIATALSATLVRNLVHIGRLFVSTFGMDRYIGATIAPALSAGLIPQLEQGFNAQYQAQIPGSGDLVRFALREVWDPTRRPELLAELPAGDFYEFMRKRGMKDDISNDYWASHWVLPSVGQLNEMVHRRVIDDAEWDRFVKYNDFDPAVRPWLKEISYSPYTRVDIRRMYDLGLVTRLEVKDNYLDLGYDEEHAEKMTVWTLAYVLAVEMRARYSKGWVTEAEVRTALLETGMPAERVNDYLEKIIKADASERLDKERDLTKTDITRSIKKGLLTKMEGVERLMDLGYAEDEAAFIVDITVSESTSAEIEADRDISKADTIKGIAEGVFTETQGKDMLMKLGYDATEAQYIIDIRVPPKKPDKLRVERDLTKAEIVKGVKKDILTWDQGATMLYDMGYDMDEADFILAINIEALTGSPETWSEMQEIVNKGRRVQGLEVKAIPSNIIELEAKLKEYTAIETKAKADGETRDFFIALEKQRMPMKRQHKQLVEQYKKGR